MILSKIMQHERKVHIKQESGSKIRRKPIGHFTVVYLVAKPLIWSEAEGDLVVLETRI